MALKPDRVEAYTDISFFMNDVAERGGVVVHMTSGSGVSMDDASAVVEYATDQSGTAPAGLLLNDVVDIDLTRQHINWHKDEVQVGSKVTVLRQGQVTTDMVASGVAPSAGDDAYYGANGLLTTDDTNSVKVGRFLSSLDADGYVKVDINIT
ncbi:hypothetical protein EB001_13605 [bacterium]|nr:hypothetical protein [bacterium]